MVEAAIAIVPFVAVYAVVIGYILYLRDRRLNPHKYRTHARRREELETWAILDEIDRDGW